MATLKVNSASLTAVANAIRTAADTDDTLTFPAGFVSAIEGLSGGSGGTQFVIGAQNVAETDSLTIGDLPFEPTDALILLTRRSTTKGVLVNATSNPHYTAASAYGAYTNGTSGYITNISANNFTFGEDSVTYTSTSAFSIYGVYLYLIWHEEAGT